MTLHQIPNTIKTDSFWMPFTANRQFKKAPRLFSSAEGMHYTTVDGRKVIDGSAGLWCVNAGHGRKQIAAAVERQLMNLDFAPSFQMGHPIAFDFARRLAEIAPKGLDRVFCTNCGSRVFTNNLKDGSGIVFVQEGSLDRLDEWFAPKAEINTWSRQPWMRPLALPQFDHGPR